MLLLLPIGDERSGFAQGVSLFCRYFWARSIAEGEYLNKIKTVCMYMKYIKVLEKVTYSLATSYT